MIPITPSQFELLTYEPAVPKIYATLGTRMDRMRFTLTDESGNYVDLNGAPMTILPGRVSIIDGLFFTANTKPAIVVNKKMSGQSSPHKPTRKDTPTFLLRKLHVDTQRACSDHVIPQGTVHITKTITTHPESDWISLEESIENDTGALPQYRPTGLLPLQ